MAVVVEIQSFPIGKHEASFGIISRRATGRVGTRYHSRGIDDKGHVSNFVETEQLLIAGQDVFSFAQVRGSIPLFWRQNINIRYKPPFEFYNYSQMSNVFAKHFEQLINSYHQVTAVNLVDQRGWEGQLAREYAKQARDLGNSKLHYLHFDFHKECSKLQWHRISLLLDRIKQDMEHQTYFHGMRDVSSGEYRMAFTKVYSTQKGVIRTNCIDCLDRTNVVQSYIGRSALTLQLRELGWLDVKETIEQDVPHLDLLLKQIWADNGDALSRQYAGTGALKADFTRTGRPSRKGLVTDGINSLIRYYLNNFSDGQRQDAMDLFFGQYTIRLDDYYSPFIYEFDNRLLLAPAILVISFLLLFYFGLISRPARLSGFLVFALAAMVFTLSAFLILQNGIHYVQYPRLRPPPVVSQIRPFSSKIGAGRRKLYDMVVPSRKVHVI